MNVVVNISIVEQAMIIVEQGAKEAPVRLHLMFQLLVSSLMHSSMSLLIELHLLVLERDSLLDLYFSTPSARITDSQELVQLKTTSAKLLRSSLTQHTRLDIFATLKKQMELQRITAMNAIHNTFV